MANHELGGRNRPAANCRAWVTALVLSVVLPAAAQVANLVPNAQLGLRVAPGFQVSLFADANLANDISAMALDPRGEVTVTGPGYIRTLRDTDGDGRADSATQFAATTTGGMGLCWTSNSLFFVGEGWLQRFDDNNQDGVADGPPERLLPLAHAEHGGHAVRQGPDGAFYVIAGNDAGVTNLTLAPFQVPNGQIDGGVLLRLDRDGKNPQCIAHGFRNPYDFDFNESGDLFTYDSDAEGDYLLPWYVPTRLFHIGHGQHHGWLLPGWTRSWNRPDYYVDTVDILSRLGRGSPTGVVCYRHLQFPQRYRDGLFVLDWTFGRVWFVPLVPAGSTYQSVPELFLEPIGTQGFAPTDIVVTPEGSLLIAIGGRKTRGAIYRVDFVADANALPAARNWRAAVGTGFLTVLVAPQPLEAWSRNLWMPIAIEVGAAPFVASAVDTSLAPNLRIRAIELLTELHGGLPLTAATAAARDALPEVRARVAWSLGRVPVEGSAPLLAELARDVDPAVRRTALEAIGDLSLAFDPALRQQAIIANLAHPDERVRLACARVASKITEAEWNTLWSDLANSDAPIRLTATLALLWRAPLTAISQPALDAVLPILSLSRNPEERLQGVRLVMLALGGYNLSQPTREIYTAYETALPLARDLPAVARIRQAIHPGYPTGNGTLDFELARLFAMVTHEATNLPIQVLTQITDRTTPGSDLHHLIVLSRLGTLYPTSLRARVARALLGIDRKLDLAKVRAKQTWSLRLAELTSALVERDAFLADALLADAAFAQPAHLLLANALGAERRAEAARRFHTAVQANPRFPWSAELIDLLSALPPGTSFPLFRRQWANPALRDEITLRLAQHPEAADRERFITGLVSARAEVARASVAALLRLPADESKRSLLAALRLLQRAAYPPADQALRAQVLELLSRETGHTFSIREGPTDPLSLQQAYQPVFQWFSQNNPALIKALNQPLQSDVTEGLRLVSTAPWSRGDAARGEALFRERGCAVCHAGVTTLGPDLGGITRRMSTADLFRAILEPNRDIAAPYRTTTFQTRDGQTHTGLVVFDSAEGVLVQTDAGTTVRLLASDIVSRQPGQVSIMPSGLLTGLPPQSYADLYAYLRTLQPSR